MRPRHLSPKLPLTLAFGLCALMSAPTAADAFCGFYVSGAGGDMFNNATQVVLMREGTRTVLSMQNNYQGPPENFAMVVPVPEVLQEENVKTLDKGIFKRIDQLAAPRLVEYWEQDPCARPRRVKTKSAAPRRAKGAAKKESAPAKDLGVTIEAEFTVGEYQIVILSAKDSTGLDTWLRQEKYKIPEGAEPLLRPYVEAGSKFFVAKVDTAKVTFKDGMAMLSPLRFHYDSEGFSLPVRLGLINSSGTQDLIVHILAKGKRYQVSNYKNATIPTNLDVNDEVRTRFGEFYAALFDATLEKNPGAVITEYSWDAGSCDPCPTPALNRRELATLGEDVLYLPPTNPITPAAPAAASKPEPTAAPGRSRSKRAPRRRPRRRWSGFVLTRLHARYGKGDVANDLIFEEAPAIVGGREFHQDGALEKGSRSSSINNFQARYAIRHEWTGPVTCENPRRGIWGGPPAGVSGSSSPKPALELAFAPRGKIKLASMVRGDVPELAIAASGDSAQPATDTAATPAADKAKPPTEPASQPKPKSKKSQGCSASEPTTGHAPALALALLGLLALGRVRRRSSM